MGDRYESDVVLKAILKDEEVSKGANRIERRLNKLGNNQGLKKIVSSANTELEDFVGILKRAGAEGFMRTEMKDAISATKQIGVGKKLRITGSRTPEGAFWKTRESYSIDLDAEKKAELKKQAQSERIRIREEKEADKTRLRKQKEDERVVRLAKREEEQKAKAKLKKEETAAKLAKREKEQKAKATQRKYEKERGFSEVTRSIGGKTQVTTGFFGKDGERKIQSVTRRLGGFRMELLSLLFTSQQLNNSFRGLMNAGFQLTGLFEVMPVLIGGAMLPAMLPLSQMITNIGVGFLDLDPNIQLVIGSFVTLGYVITKGLAAYSQIGLLLSGFHKTNESLFGGKKKGKGGKVEIGWWKQFTTKLINWLSPAGKAVSKFYGGLKKLFTSKKAMGSMGGVFGAMAKAAKTLGASIIALGTAFLAGLGTPLGLIVTTLLVLVALWWWFGDEIETSMQSANKKFNESSPRLGDKVISLFKGIKDYVANLKLGDAFGDVLTSVESTINSWKEKLKTAFYGLLPDWIKNPKATFTSVTTAISDWLKELPTKISAGATAIKEAILGFFPSVSEITSKVGAFANYVIQGATKIYNSIAGERTPSNTEIKGTQALVNEYKLRHPGATKEDYFKEYPNDAWIKKYIAGGFMSSPYVTSRGTVYEGIHQAQGLYDLNASRAGNNLTYAPVINITASISSDMDLRKIADRLDSMMQDRMRKYVRGT